MKRISAETEKLRGMPFRKAAEYIWDYYKLWLAGSVCFLALFVYLAAHILSAPKEQRLFIAFANTMAEVGTGSALWQDYVDHTGYDPEEQTIEFNDALYFDYSMNRGRGNQYYAMFVTFVEAGTLDAVTMPPESLTALGQSGRLLDLSREECASIREKYADRFLYTVPYDEAYSTKPVPVGIDVSDSILMTRHQIYTGGCGLGIGAYSQRLDAVEQFLDYIFEEGQGNA